MTVLDSIKEKAGSVLNSTGGINKAGIDAIEKSSQVALESARYYTGTGIKQLRAAATIRDFDSLRGFVSDSIVLSGQVFKHAVEDFQKSLALGAEFRANVTDLFKSSAEDIKPAPVTPPPSKKGAAAA